MPTPAAGTQLSDLPDDLLQRIHYLVPAKEAARTAVLARRWRSLWPTPWSGAGVHLDTRSYQRPADGGYDSFRCRRRAFFRDAKAALATHGSVKTLTIRVEEEYRAIPKFMFRDLSSWPRDNSDIVDDVICHPSCWDVEELHIEAHNTPRSPAAGSTSTMSYYHGDGGSWAPRADVGYYNLSLGTVPSRALRELHITNCSRLAPPPPDALFPCQRVLRLHSCGVSLDTLQDMAMASPELDTLHLDHVFITTKVCYPTNSSTEIQGFCCPTVTTLVLADCCYDTYSFTIELDAPRVRHFRYSGKVNTFYLKSPPPDLRRVDLHIFDRQDCTTFWPFLLNFRSTKDLKLKLECPVEDIAVDDKKSHDELLRETWFGNLEHLEVDGKHKPASKDDTAVAIGNFLQCCPAVVDLSLKLNIVDHQPQPYGRRHSSYLSTWKNRRALLNRKAQMDFRKSVYHFMHRKDQVVPFGGDDVKYDEVSDIHGLSDKWFNFNCLQFYLKRVSLQFCSEKSNSFGVQLAKFFFDKAMVLEEMHIDDGNHKMCEHVNRKFGGHKTNPLQPCSEYKVFPGVSQEPGVKRFSSLRNRDRLPSSSKHEVRRRNQWSSGFTILPLER